MIFLTNAVNEAVDEVKTWVRAYVETQIDKHERDNKHETRSVWTCTDYQSPTVQSLTRDLKGVNARIDLLMTHFNLEPKTYPSETVLIDKEDA